MIFPGMKLILPDFSNLPPLYFTESIAAEDKIIHQRWIHTFCPGFFWLIVEYDPQSQIAFGFSCLNDPVNTEWGNIFIPELLECGAMIDHSFHPTPFKLLHLFS